FPLLDESRIACACRSREAPAAALNLLQKAAHGPKPFYLMIEFRLFRAANPCHSPEALQEMMDEHAHDRPSIGPHPRTRSTRSVRCASGLVVCWACPAAWG